MADEHKRIEEYQDGLWGEFGKAYFEFADQALEEMNDALDAKQRQQFKKLIGTPINWARMIESWDDFEYVFRVSDPNGNLESVGVRRGPTNPTEAVDELPKVDVFLFMLLSTEFLRKELDLTEKQNLKLLKTLKDYRQHRVVDESDSVARFEALLNSKVSFPKEVTDLLVRHQEGCLRQVELQFRTGNYRYSFGLLHPQLAEKLELSEKQKATINRVSVRFRDEVTEFSAEAKRQFASLMRDEYLKTMKILNSKQLARYSLLTGLDTSGIQSR